MNKQEIRKLLVAAGEQSMRNWINLDTLTSSYYKLFTINSQTH